MAPLVLSAAQLQRCYSPLTLRRVQPTAGGRAVPCCRLARSVSRAEVVVKAVSEETVADSAQGENGANGAEHDRLAGASRATKAVHGGERAGRPRVAGGPADGAAWEAHCAAAAAAACRRRQPPARLVLAAPLVLPCLGGSCEHPEGCPAPWVT